MLYLLPHATKREIAEASTVKPESGEWVSMTKTQLTKALKLSLAYGMIEDGKIAAMVDDRPKDAASCIIIRGSRLQSLLIMIENARRYVVVNADTGGLVGFHERLPSAPDGDVIEIDAKAHAHLVLELGKEGRKIYYDGEKFETRIEKHTRTMGDIRQTRNKFLRETDWTQIPDCTLSGDADMVAYRQELRDIPETFAGDPDAVKWPANPLDG